VVFDDESAAWVHAIIDSALSGNSASSPPSNASRCGSETGGCMFPGCDRGTDYGEAHHIDEWVADHGKTNVADGILLCRHHHMLLHNNKWKITRQNSAYRLIPPPAIDPERKPIPLHSSSPLRHPRTGQTAAQRRHTGRRDQVDTGATPGDMMLRWTARTS
jgi:hypothetical protein